MSKILNKGEIGFGLLIERDAGYISHDINKHIISESIEIKPNEPILINCILQKWGVENRNGRIYPKDVLVPQVELYQKLVDTNSAISEADHPESSVISLHNISHMITKMWWGSGDDDNILFGELKIIVTPGFLKYGVVSVVGDKILLYLQNKIRLGISSRGVGTLKTVNGKNLVQNDFELIGFDLVSTPSTPGGYLFTSDSSYISKPNIKPISMNENSDKLINAIDKFIF